MSARHTQECQPTVPCHSKMRSYDGSLFACLVPDGHPISIAINKQPKRSEPSLPNTELAAWCGLSDVVCCLLAATITLLSLVIRSLGDTALPMLPCCELKLLRSLLFGPKFERGSSGTAHVRTYSTSKGRDQEASD